MTVTSSAFKKVEKTVVSIEQAEGVGARVRRSIGTFQLRNLDPFLMLDEFSIAKPAGFPDHPHRGFETVTYMLDGSVQHEDFAGHKGTIGTGDLQWMTAGRGILHAEMPLTDTAHGLQLWVNLPRKDKMVEPRYQELLDKDVPRATSPDGSVRVKVIAGESYGVNAKVHTYIPIYYLDVRMDAGKEFVQAVPENYTTFLYTLSGDIKVGEDATEQVKPHTTVVLGAEGDAVKVTSVNDAHFVLVAGQKINEPIAQHGPFVLNDREGILQAFMDYEQGKNGFEGAKRWASEIGNRR
ncbi:hypothetical protein HDU85_002310 [Gaertneriomyces sp. JEL0708]|nr:hypothetical protein HDU85_002310 [Gaertneriomyces sp. JEL0708]